MLDLLDRSARSGSHGLPQLLALLDPQAPLAQRHLWLIGLCEWIRGQEHSCAPCLERMRQFIDTVQADPATHARLRAWWAVLVQSLDLTTLLADFGFAPRTAFFSELSVRLRSKILPSSPETLDAAELFTLALPQALDAQWLAQLDDATLKRLVALLNDNDNDNDNPDHAQQWQRVVLDAMTYCAGQMLATGFAPELRLRMSDSARAQQPFHALLREIESLRVEVLHPLRTPERLQAVAQALRERLDACRVAINSVYAHFEDNGISVGLVFRIRQMRGRILRLRTLLDGVLSPQPARDMARLLSQLVLLGRERRSLRALIAANSSLVAAKVAQRSAETGEHYISHDRTEYHTMLRKAAGGGAVMAVTTLIKFGLYALALSAFWGGFWAGMNYAVSFVLIQLLHFTVATKQPAMTAPAMAAKLKDLQGSAAVQEFVNEVCCLVRTQVAAVLGNVLVVFPAALLLSLALVPLLGHAPLSEERAQQTLGNLSLLGPSALFAAYTGVLLFASSIVAGWTENWFVLLRLESALRYNPRIVRTLGALRAERWAHFGRENISGLAANVSLGLMLGMTPAFAGFFGLGLDARHVTLTSGQIGAATLTLGWAVLSSSAFWWAVAFIPINAMLNVGVSFYLAFLTALRAQNVSVKDRHRIYGAIRARLLHAPLDFFWPTTPLNK